MTDKRKLKPDELLMASIGFDEDDLEANRAGKLGRNQRERLQRMRREAKLDRFAMTLMSIVISVPGLILVLGSLVNSSQEWLLGTPILIAGLAFFGRKAWQSLRLADSQHSDLFMGKIARIEGRISLDVQARNNKSGPGSVEYTVRLEGRKLIVTREVFLAFKNGDPYALYYAPRSNVLLAAEWLREPPPGMDRPADDEDKEWVDIQEKPKHGGLSR